MSRERDQLIRAIAESTGLNFYFVERTIDAWIRDVAKYEIEEHEHKEHS